MARSLQRELWAKPAYRLPTQTEMELMRFDWDAEQAFAALRESVDSQPGCETVTPASSEDRAEHLQEGVKDSLRDEPRRRSVSTSKK